MSPDEVIVIGAGGHAKVVIAACKAAGLTVKAAYDDNPAKRGSSILGVPVAGSISDLTSLQGVRAVIAIGDNKTRQSLANRFPKIEWATIVHPSAFVDPTVKLGPGTVVFAKAVVQPEAVIGAHCIVNTAASVDHECSISDFAHIAAGAHLSGAVKVGEGALLGTGSAFSPGVSVGEWAKVGVGAIVVMNVPAHSTVVGKSAMPCGPK